MYKRQQIIYIYAADFPAVVHYDLRYLSVYCTHAVPLEVHRRHGGKGTGEMCIRDRSERHPGKQRRGYYEIDHHPEQENDLHPADTFADTGNQPLRTKPFAHEKTNGRNRDTESVRCKKIHDPDTGAF